MRRDLAPPIDITKQIVFASWDDIATMFFAKQLLNGALINPQFLRTATDNTLKIMGVDMASAPRGVVSDVVALVLNPLAAGIPEKTNPVCPTEGVDEWVVNNIKSNI